MSLKAEVDNKFGQRTLDRDFIILLLEMSIKFVVNYSQKQNQELILYTFFTHFNQLLLYQLPPWLSLASKGQIAPLLHTMFCMHKSENLMRDETEMVGDQLPITASSTSTYINNPTLRHTVANLGLS